MFSTAELKVLDPEYFSIIRMDDYDVSVMSKNTRHYWYIHNTGYADESNVVVFHRHKSAHPYHLHMRADSLKQAVRSIKGHDRWQMNGRR